MMYIQSAGATDVGKKREGNEDSYFIDEAHQLYVVADGMGGHLAGEVASRLVVDAIRDCVINKMADESIAFDETLSNEANRLVAWIHAANQAVFQRSREDTQCHGMGSTVAAVYCTDSTLITANVGDSPVYLVRNGAIELISVTHTVAAEQAIINPKKVELLNDTFKHMLSRAIGVGEHVVPDVCEMQCLADDKIILCSDGLSNMVPQEEMLDIVNNNSPPKACELFVNLANERGGDDNITVIILNVKKAASKSWQLLRSLLQLLRVS